MNKQKMPEGWREVELRDIIEDMHQGINTVIENIKYLDKGYFIIQSKHITSGKLDLSDARFVSKENYEKYKEKYNPKKGDLLICNIGTIGKSIIVKKEEDFLIAWNLFLLKLKNDIVSPEFLKMYLDKLNAENYFDRFLTGGTVKFINKTNMGSIKIPLPPLPIQQKIVSILEKVEKAKEMRKEADELTKDFLKSCFMEMFGDERKNTKKFEIKGFLDVFDTTTGKLDSNASVEDGKYSFFTCSQETFKIDKYSFDCEALLLAGNNAAAKYSVKHYKGKFDAYQRTYILTLKNNGELYSFYHYQLEQKLGELQNKSIGTNTKYLTLGILRDIKMICPPLPLQQKFASIVKEVEAMKEQQKNSKEQIDNLFNVLMQKAFKGELV